MLIYKQSQPYAILLAWKCQGESVCTPTAPSGLFSNYLLPGNHPASNKIDVRKAYYVALTSI